MRMATFASLLLVVIGTSAFFTSQGQNYYDPVVPEERQNNNVYLAASIYNTPFISKISTFLLGAQFGASSKMNNFDLHGAYMPGSRLGLIANYSQSNYKESPDYYVEGSKKSFEFGIGYIRPSNSRIKFETYWGWGNTKFYNIHGTGTSTMNMYKWFIQPSFYIRDKLDFFQLGISSRFSLNRFKADNFSFNPDYEELVNEQFNLMLNNKNQLFIEPSIVARAGSDHIRFQFSYSFIKNLTCPGMYASSNAFGIGLVFTPQLKETKEKFY
jgi:hypothetical protein